MLTFQHGIWQKLCIMQSPCNLVVGLYDTITNDFIWTLLQQTQHRDYLMKRSKGDDLDNYELC